MSVIEPERCGNCGRFCGVTYEWRGPHYAEVVSCEHCGPAAYSYDAVSAAIEDMSSAEVKEAFSL